MFVNTNCRHYKGDIPCLPHKRENARCSDCRYYDPVKQRILIIKLGAAGDVIRTTPLLRRLVKDKPSAHITWLTEFPDFVPSKVDNVVKPDSATLFWLANRMFDIVYNLDKDPVAIALTESIQAGQKYGFGMDENGKCKPLNPEAMGKWYTGIWDDVSKHNRKSYPEEIFELCGYRFGGEKYILERKTPRNWLINQPKPLVGLNTGCGGRWPSRLWPNEFWIELAAKLQRQGLGVLWLGGSQEHAKNTKLSQAAGGHYEGFFPLKNFVDLMDECDVVVTQVTMAMHIALGLAKRLVLMNNIFNPHEFELYGLGEIIEPPVPCGCYFEPRCPHDSMRQIKPDMILNAVLRQVEELAEISAA